LHKRQKRAIDVVLETTDLLLECPEERAFSKAELWQQIDARTFRGSLADLRTFKWLEERAGTKGDIKDQKGAEMTMMNMVGSYPASTLLGIKK